MRPAMLVVVAVALSAADRTYELAGQVEPEARASVSVHAANTPFSTSTLSDARGRFRIRGLLPGPYTVSAFVPGYGEARRTIEVGPSVADGRGRVPAVLKIQESPDAAAALKRGAAVSTRELSIPDRARREYAEAQKCLARHDVNGAIRRLENAVEMAPGFAEAWNNLGTIAYQTREYSTAERHFRAALKADAEAYEPLVNLGGVLLNLGKIEEAYHYNLHAVLARPHDALANSQFGMTYFWMSNYDLALKYLNAAKKLDPAHFSHPQLLIAEVHLRRQAPDAAAAELEEFLKYHPDVPEAVRIQAKISELRRSQRYRR
jgi:tetratricopeptide (TPR) repeat protein